jgi:hypothetical protein
MAEVLIVAAAADAAFADEVKAQTRGLDIAIAPVLPASEHRTVLLVWSAASHVGAGDVPALLELWAHNRLVVARRDDTPLPPGLGDVPALPVGAPPREAAFRLLHAALAPDAVAGAAAARARGPAAASVTPAPSPPGASRRWMLAAVAAVAVLVIGLAVWFGQVDR